MILLKRSSPNLYPFLFALYPVLFFAAHNVAQLSFREAILPALCSLAIAASTFLILRVLLKNADQAAFLTFVVALLFFSYGHLYNTLAKAMGSFRMRIGAEIIGPNKALFLLYFAGLGGVLMILRRIHGQWEGVCRTLNLLGMLLVAFSIFRIGNYELKRATGGEPKSASSDNPLSPEIVSLRPSPKPLPDIYYLIFDRYANAEVLKKYYDFDNTPFLESLRQRGFFVASESYSNYPKSEHSIASSLNMSFLDKWVQRVGEESDDWSQLHPLLQDYQVMRNVKRLGYQYVHVGSWWGPTSKNSYADRNINLYPLSEFLFELYRTTMLYPIGTKLGLFDERLIQWKRVLYQFEELAKIPENAHPTFTFVHMLVPHEPYVFAPEGHFLSEMEAKQRSWRDNYVGQIIFLNQKILDLVDALRAKSDPLPIIILQADEGPPPLRYQGDDKDRFDWRGATGDELKEKMGILNAYFLPDLPPDSLYPSLTPVNSFRIIFNHYFGANLPLLPDEHYAFVDDLHPFKFFRVTDRLR